MVQVTRRIPKYLRQRRENAGLTLRQLADKTKIPHTTLHGIECGQLDAPISRIELIARAYGEDLVTFLSFIGRRPAKHIAALKDFRAIGEQPEA